MPFRVPAQLWSRTLTTSSRARTTTSPGFNPELPTLPASAPKLGRVARWYLPTMALLAVGTTYFSGESKPTYSSYERQPSTLEYARNQIGFAIANALGDHNSKQKQLTQEQKNQMLMNAFGDRSSLEDMERALEQVERDAAAQVEESTNERNNRLLEAYGEKTSLRDLERAMEIYEVQ